MRDFRNRVEQQLDNWLPDKAIQPVRLHEAMRYAVLGNGKRIRPCLTYAAGQALDLPQSVLDGPACAVELIHAYSLVHDDLPAMDNDDLRRGIPTCHKAFDEATAILAGDALQSLAFHILTSDPAMNIEATARCKMVNALAVATGSRGMAGGQAMDLEAEGQELNLAQLEEMHIHKTGALIHASIRLAGLARPDCPGEQLKALDHYAKCLGLAFQIKDDILDVEADTETLGKPQGSDQARAKSTYPALLGLSEAKNMAAELLDSGLNSLAVFDEKADPLRWIASYIVERTY
jgi:geranylgeranyl diphosphate synthase type II